MDVLPRLATGSDLHAAAELLAGAETLLILTGSGMSRESGLPTFRGPEGLWRGVKPEDVASIDAFRRDPKWVWEWYRERILAHRNVEPNPGHRAVARLQKQFGRSTLATQNVDVLHERAGSKGVLHLHGQLNFVRCMSCTRRLPLEPVLLETLPPPCPACAGILRPDVVWFGEALPEGPFQEAVAAAHACDVALVVGTSNLVYPAAMLPQFAKQEGAAVIEVNPESTPLTPDADVALAGTAADVLPTLERLVADLRRTRRRGGARPGFANA